MPLSNYPIINTHCHILNFAFVPDKMFKILSGIDENLVRNGSIQDIVEAIVRIMPGVKYDHIFLKTRKFLAAILILSVKKHLNFLKNIICQVGLSNKKIDSD